jgi:hypothetical protein
MLEKLNATVTADSSHPEHRPELTIDQNPNTIWHTQWEPMDAPPHYLILDLKKPLKIQGLTYLPRQDMNNGRIARYEIYVSNNTEDWGEPVATGKWRNSKQLCEVRFSKAYEARFIKVLALSEVNGQPFTSAAEIGVLFEQ